MRTTVRRLPPVLVIVIGGISTMALSFVIEGFTDWPTALRWCVAILASVLVTKALMPRPESGGRGEGTEQG